MPLRRPGKMCIASPIEYWNAWRGLGPVVWDGCTVSVRPDCGRWTGILGPFFCSGAVLVRPDYGEGRDRHHAGVVFLTILLMSNPRSRQASL